MSSARSCYPSADASREFGARPAAIISAVEEDSPAYDAGFEPGCRLLSVNGAPLRDVIDWQWLSADDELELEYIDNDGDCGFVTLFREEGEPWGFSFEGLIFDGVRTCRNACTFCFMRQLPKGMRPSLYLRDDDYRLSFLGGTFVTLSNLEAADEQRIVEQQLSPLRVSLHAVDADVRRRLLGVHAEAGFAAFERLLAAGVQAHVQVVLLPGENDGEVLLRTLEWAYAHPGIQNVGIVPLGFTRHQDVFAASFNEAASARAVLDLIEPFQERALAERGTPWVFAADEFYSSAFGEKLFDYLPDQAFYGEYELFEDGIGMIRSFADDFAAALRSGLAERVREALDSRGHRAYYVCGLAMRSVFSALLPGSGLESVFRPLYVENGFFGGNVDVTGLLCGCDMAHAVKRAYEQDSKSLFLVPQVVFNNDSLTLDDLTLEDMENAAGVSLHMVSCNPAGFLRELAELESGD